MNYRAIVFDGDDTLWDTQPLYEEAKVTFEDAMSKAGLDAQRARKLLEEIDLHNLQYYGFSADRFSHSLVQTYQSLAEAARVPTNRSVAATVRSIGESVFLRRASPLPAVRRVLADLAADYHLILATKGDVALQRKRIKDSRLAELFIATYIMSDKTVENFLHIAREQNLDMARSWSVGNSLRSDVLPALTAGYKAVWIRRYTWSFEEIPLEIHPVANDSELLIVDDLQQLPRIIRNITS